jgi:hypothetical protein
VWGGVAAITDEVRVQGRRLHPLFILAVFYHFFSCYYYFFAA